MTAHVLIGVGAVILGLVIGGAIVLTAGAWIHRDRSDHNDRDYACRFWWGDRSAGAADERCPVCNPR